MLIMANWGVYFVKKADLDPLIFVPARECAKAHSFLLSCPTKILRKGKGLSIMKKVVIIDGQGGRMGRALVEEIHKLCPGQPLLALGANTTATAAMMKAGAAMGATEKTPFSSPAAMPT